MTQTFRLTLAQLNPTLGALKDNAAKALEAWEAGKTAGAQFVALPEMFLTGYQTQDLVMRPAFAADAGLFPVNVVTKRIVVVDSDIDVFDLEDVEWAVWSRLSNAPLISRKTPIPWRCRRIADSILSITRLRAVSVDLPFWKANCDEIMGHDEK